MGDEPRLVVDLGGVTFLDSSGINVFLQVHRAVTADHGWLRLAAAHGPVIRVLQLVGLNVVIPCHETTEQALASC
ncbi:STAS domain-containing protein [Streptomyces wuyuanensis]|uniref:STAS domain-containing protein n=1 Tax=Streptomyces wuyuanensis TaxID=1196353 RepID=UPI003423FB91